MDLSAHGLSHGVPHKQTMHAPLLLAMPPAMFQNQQKTMEST
jgi:hypothetical protein